jgi:hypothetical protein
MSGHGKREKILMANAASWRDRVSEDVERLVADRGVRQLAYPVFFIAIRDWRCEAWFIGRQPAPPLYAKPTQERLRRGSFRLVPVCQEIAPDVLAASRELPVPSVP